MNKFMVDELLHEKDATSNSVKGERTMKEYYTMRQFAIDMTAAVIIAIALISLVLWYIA